MFNKKKAEKLYDSIEQCIGPNSLYIYGPEESLVRAIEIIFKKEGFKRFNVRKIIEKRKLLYESKELDKKALENVRFIISECHLDIDDSF